MVLAFFSGELTEWGNIFLDFGSASPLVVGAHALDATPLSSPLAILRTFPLFCIMFSWISLTLPYLWTCLTTPTQFSFNRLLACFKPPPLATQCILSLSWWCWHWKVTLSSIFHPHQINGRRRRSKWFVKTLILLGRAARLSPPSQKASELTGSFEKWNLHINI